MPMKIIHSFIFIDANPRNIGEQELLVQSPGLSEAFDPLNVLSVVQAAPSDDVNQHNDK
jgi:hypothetical protein